jgi:chromosomal replication initiation ATPase DnaA
MVRLAEADPQAARIVELSAKLCRVGSERLLSASRAARVVRARQLAIYLIHVALHRSIVDAGRAIGRDRTTASYACTCIEDLRDNKLFDLQVSRLEAMVAPTPMEALRAAG